MFGSCSDFSENNFRSVDARLIVAQLHYVMSEANTCYKYATIGERAASKCCLLIHFSPVNTHGSHF